MKLFFEEIRSKYPASDAAQKKEHLGAYIGTTLVAKIKPQQYSDQKRYCLYLLDLEDEERMTFGGRFNYIAQAIAEANAWYLENHQKINRSKPSAYPAVALPSSDEAEFYPTPSHIAGYMIRRIDWKNVRSVLEPSAGSGSLCDALRSFGKSLRSSRFSDSAKGQGIFCIERDTNLSAILKGKGYRVISDDFLEFTTFQHFDVILMNPPFSNGDTHLLRAILMQERCGGQICCLLNAETIRNPYTNSRKVLAQKLAQHCAKVEFISDAFKHAERPSSVEIALVSMNIQAPPMDSFILSGLESARTPYDGTDPGVPTDIVSSDWMEALVADYLKEAQIGESLIREYMALKPYIMESATNYANANITLRIGRDHEIDNFPNGMSEYLLKLREKYWSILLHRPELTSLMTSTMQDAYYNQISVFVDYDFSVKNIKKILREIGHHLQIGVEESIMTLFDTMSAKHSWYPECSKNIHYYNGWKSNLAHRVNEKKVIIPVNGCCQDPRFYMGKLDEYRVFAVISDLERALAYLERGDKILRTDVSNAIRMANSAMKTTVNFTYFSATFYKKGTCHIKFYEETKPLIDRLNIFGAQNRGWLPPCYGKKHYTDMTEDEKAVIDGLHGIPDEAVPGSGADAYEAILKQPDKYLLKREDLALPLLVTDNTVEHEKF